jgi:type II secretory ATPase GspE/PulE/Tfp pilus assembly ATPase PilB-like protein
MDALHLECHHPIAVEAGESFIRLLIDTGRDETIKEDWVKDWAEREAVKGIQVVDFISVRIDRTPETILSWAFREYKTPLIDCDHCAPPSKQYIFPGLPLLLITQTEFGVATYVHCVPSLENKLDQTLLADLANALKIHFVLTTPQNFLTLFKKIESQGKWEIRELERLPEDKPPQFDSQLHTLKKLGMLPEDFHSDSRHEILAKLKKPSGDLGETEWYALTDNDPFLNLSILPSAEKLVEKCPPPKQRVLNIIPISEHHNILTIACKHKIRKELVEITSSLSYQGKICGVLARERQINEQITANLSTSSNTQDIASKITLTSRSDEMSNEIIDTEKFDEGEENIIKLVQSILMTAVSKKTTDIHISSDEQNTRIRLRVDGILMDAEFKQTRAYCRPIINRIKILSGIDTKYSPKAQDGKFPLTVGKDNYDIRVNTCPTIWGEKAVLRVQKKESKAITLEELGFHKHEETLLRNVLDSDHGLLVICGPTGSGKTTTLAAAINTIDRKRWNVITAEHPVEVRLENVEQTQVDGHNMTFGSFIPAALRQDPDYIMIGETRDFETASEVIRAAITGHVVMTTLHSNSAPGAIARLLDLKVAPFLLTDAIKAICAQRLIRRLCTCAVPARTAPTKEELKANGIPPEWLENTSQLKEASPTGCKACNGQGYKGRIAIIEGYYTSPRIRQIIMHENGDSEKIKKEMENQGGRTLYQQAVELASRGITSLKEALTVKTLDGE